MKTGLVTCFSAKNIQLKNIWYFYFTKLIVDEKIIVTNCDSCI
jgi:hypothetical protein